MADTLAILLTMTTYGTWLRGDARGWVDEGTVFPPNPALEAADRSRMKYPEYRFTSDAWLPIGQSIGVSLVERLSLQIYAMTVQSWHVHIVFGANSAPLGKVVKCAKDAARWELRANRPIWGDGYDKRYCFDVKSVAARIEYVERHNLNAGRPAKPWSFIVPPV